MAHRRVGELHEGLLHGPGAGGPHRQPRRQRAPSRCAGSWSTAPCRVGAAVARRRQGRSAASRRAPRPPRSGRSRSPRSAAPVEPGTRSTSATAAPAAAWRSCRCDEAAPLALLVVLAAAVLGGGVQRRRRRRARAAPPDEPPTAPVDYSGVALAGVPGDDHDDHRPRQGTASIIGTRAGPGGLVPGATVRIERLVAGQEIRTRRARRVRTAASSCATSPAAATGCGPSSPRHSPLVTPDVRFLAGRRGAHVRPRDDRPARRRRARRRRARSALPRRRREPRRGRGQRSRSTPTASCAARRCPASGWSSTGSARGSSASDRGLRDAAAAARPRPPREAPVPPSTVAFTDGRGQVRYELTCDQAGAAGPVAARVGHGDAAGRSRASRRRCPSSVSSACRSTVPDCVDPTASTEPPDGRRRHRRTRSTTTEDDG